MTRLHSPRTQALRTRLREAREAHGVTQFELANKLNKPQSFVSKFETGERRLDVIEFADVCAALDLDAAEFLKEFLAATATNLPRRTKRLSKPASKN